MRKTTASEYLQITLEGQDMNTTVVCTNCKMKRDTMLFDRIRQIENLLSHIETEEPRRGRIRGIFYWDINLHCPYGMSCPELRQIQLKTEKLARKLEPKMVKLAESDDERMYREVLKHLAGFFPRVYQRMEKIHQAKKTQ